MRLLQSSPFKNLGIVYGNAALINEGNFESYYFAVNAEKRIIKKRIIGDIYLSVLLGGDSICSVSAMIKKLF
jgi:vancomycin permeability regulator SanA